MYTVVIADDEKLICDEICAVIRSALPELRIARVFHDGQQAYDYLCSNRTDILLLDIEMPGKSGLDIAELIQRQNCSSYIILITAYRDFEYAKKAIDYHVGAFLTKPFSTQQLVSSLRQALSTFPLENSDADSQWQAYRSLLYSLYMGRMDIESFNDIKLCNRFVPIRDLNCTEIAVHAPDFGTLPKDSQEILLSRLTHCVEGDSGQQSSFLLGAREDTLTFLLFSILQPDLAFMADALDIIEACTGRRPNNTVKTFSSFSEYRMYLSFVREMEDFLATLSNDGFRQALQKMEHYIHACSPDERHLFARFLMDFYQLAIPDATEGAILQALTSLVNRMAGTHSSHYIIDSAKEYIGTNFAASSMSLENVADFLHISSVYLSRIFKKYTGQTFSEYLLEFRMSHAQKLLKSTNLSTVEIAEACGYYNPAYFRAAFKAYSGITPRQFRQLRTSKKE